MATSGMSTYLANKVLDYLLGNVSFTPPATVYAALFTAAPSDAGGGTECTGGSYARAAITNDDDNWGPASGGATSNILQIDFAPLSATIGTVTHIGVFDALTSGHLLLWGPLPTPKPTANGDALSFTIGALPFAIIDAT